MAGAARRLHPTATGLGPLYPGSINAVVLVPSRPAVCSGLGRLRHLLRTAASIDGASNERASGNMLPHILRYRVMDGFSYFWPTAVPVHPSQIPYAAAARLKPSVPVERKRPLSTHEALPAARWLQPRASNPADSSGLAVRAAWSAPSHARRCKVRHSCQVRPMTMRSTSVRASNQTEWVNV